MSPPTVPILRQIEPLHASTSHFLKIYFIITSPPMSESPNWSLSLRFPQRKYARTSSLLIRATCLAYLILLDFITPKIFSEDYRLFISSLCSFLHSPVTSVSGPNIFLSTLFSNSLSLHFSLNVNENASHP